MGPTILATLLLAIALPGNATPIKPDIRKLVAQPSQDTIQFAPARAGWSGPEAATNNSQFTNPAVERLTPAAARREARASLLALAIPDWRVLVAIAGLIVLLRVAMRKKPETVAVETPVAEAEGLRPAA